MSARLSILALFVAVMAHGCDGCDNSGPIKDDTGPEVTVDADGDGFTTDEDCDDADPSVHPGAEEACDEIDNDCDGEIDEGADSVYYGDVDGDGFGDPGTTIEACGAPSGYVEDATDCDDDDADVNPAADELCNGMDDDCDGLIDDEDDSLVQNSAPTWYMDADGDGYGVDVVSVQACVAPSGYVATSDDCDDDNATVFPGADEYCNGIDDDCDGDIDEDTVDAETRWYPDADGDGYGDPGEVLIQCNQPTGYVLDATDCDDADPSTYPGSTEYCDGTDNDCDGLVDEDDAVDGATWYADGDGDGYGDAATSSYACYQPSGYVLDDTDCDDADAAQHPGAYEYCNGEDDDCDGVIDEDDAVDVVTWYADSDGDSYGDAADSQLDCNEPSGYVLDDTDCDDTDAAVFPSADEYCNGYDDDCDGFIDEDDAVDVSTWYADRDADGYGDAATTAIDCDQPSRYVADDTDCDDRDASQNPGADEYCNGEDDDCDGDIDEDDAMDVSVWFEDADADGWGNDSVMDTDCDQPSGYVARGGDCDDTDAAYNPAASETDCADPNDYNCDGSVAYADNDGDGYAACEECDDNDAAQYPGADEYCNGEDDDCDGLVDEDEAVDVATWYADADMDGYGDPGVTDIDCDQPLGYVADSADCDDTDATQFPGADERCNGEDDDCDGAADEDSAVDVLTWYADADADGYGDAAVVDIDCVQPTGFTADSSDCDDSRSDVSPAGLEICDALNADEDCDGLADDADPGVDPTTRTTWYQDLDGDGVGSLAYGSEGPLCDHSAGYSPDDGDCDETSTTIHALHDEICDDIDNDCDAGTTDLGVISVGSSAFTSLAAAVTAAPAGGVVMICDGIHSANVTTSVPITLRSLHGAASTILDGGGTGPVITMGDDLTVEGLVLTGGAGVTGGAIDGSVGGGASLVIDACVFEGNEADSGGAIYAYELDMTIANSELFDNTATSRGGALTIAQGTDLDLGTMELHGNEASYGGAAYLEDQLVSGGAYFENHADYGGGVFLMGATLQGAEIYENLASNSGGGAALDGGAALLGATVQLNLAQSGGGVILQGDDCRLGGHPDSGAATTITLNEATVYGGGLAGFSITDTLLEDTGISDNLAYYGGGIYLQGGGVLTATDLEISSNVASNTGGGIYLLDATGLDIAELVLADNWAGSSGGGGLLDSCSGAFTVAGATSTDNHAGSLGGGLYMVDVAVADITGMTLERNEGMGRQGGGFYLDSGVLLNVAGSFGSGPDANTPDDIGLTGRSFTFTTWAECDSDRLSCSGG